MRLSLVAVVLAAFFSLEAQATTRRVCTDQACVDVHHEALGTNPGTYLEVKNQSAVPLVDHQIIVDHLCFGGFTQTQEYVVTGTLAPGAVRTLWPSTSICNGGPAGARIHLHGRPLVFVPSGRSVSVGTPTTPLPDIKLPSGGKGPELPSPKLSGGGSDKGGGELILIALAVAGAAAAALVIAAVVLGTGALMGMLTGFVTAKVLDRERLAWWQNILIMDTPLAVALGVGFLIGAVSFAASLYLAFAVTTWWAIPVALALGAVWFGGFGLLLLAGTVVGTVAVVVSNALYTEPLVDTSAETAPAGAAPAPTPEDGWEQGLEAQEVPAP